VEDNIKVIGCEGMD